jgi:hypothetical protein
VQVHGPRKKKPVLRRSCKICPKMVSRPGPLMGSGRRLQSAWITHGRVTSAVISGMVILHVFLESRSISAGTTLYTRDYKTVVRCHGGSTLTIISSSKSKYSACSRLIKLAHFLSRVASLDLDTEEGIDWSTLPDEGWKTWTGRKLQQKWASLKKEVRSSDSTHRGEYSVPPTGMLTTNLAQDIVQRLLAKYALLPSASTTPS